MTISLVIAFAVLHCWTEIRNNRPHLTWLPWWLYTNCNWFDGVEHIPYIRNIDGYHVFKELSHWLMFAAGASFAGPWWLLLVLFAVKGVVFDYCYHRLFIKHEHRFE